MLVSALQQGESAISIHISPSSRTSLPCPHPTLNSCIVSPPQMVTPACSLGAALALCSGSLTGVSASIHCFCAPEWSSDFLHMALDLCRDRLQCWGAAGGLPECLEATEIGVRRSLESGQQPDFWSHISEQKAVSSQASSVHCHLPFHCLSWTPRTEGKEFHGICKGWIGELASAEQRIKAGRGRQTPPGWWMPVRLHLMSSPEQPSTGKSIPFSTFSAGRPLLIASHASSSVLLGSETVLWPRSQP